MDLRCAIFGKASGEAQTVTYDPERQMDDTKLLETSEFAEATVQHMDE